MSHHFFVNILVVGVDSDIAGAYFDVGADVPALIEFKYSAWDCCVFSKDKFYTGMPLSLTADPSMNHNHLFSDSKLKFKVKMDSFNLFEVSKETCFFL